ncbi:MAG: efflux transporter outer membrane subunit [Akkermansiaceae bacterium]|nr:efflux transporter outer membrane subunit [Akkermansiaceae bacterium]
MKSARLLILPLAALLAAGCASHTGLNADQPLPADWKNAGGFPVASPSRDLSRWWTKFNDPVLNRLVGTALENSPDMATASARIRESRANFDAQRSALFPSLSGSAGTNYNAASNNSIGTTSNSFSTGLSASWEIDLFGRLRSQLQTAAANLGATEENYNSVQAAIASEMAISYVTLRSLESRLATVRASLGSREETYNLAKFRQQAGLIDTLEADQALTSLQQARASIPSLEQSSAQTRNLINRLAGKNPGSLDGLLNSGRKAVPNPQKSLAIGIPADTIRQRPDVRVAGYQLLAAAASVRSAEAQKYPSLNLSGSLGLNTITSGKLFNPETASAGLAAGITSPIFDAGRIRAQIAANKAFEEQAVQTYRSNVLTALSEVEDSLIACRKSAERLDTLREAETSARSAANLSQQRYEAGVTDILTVLDSQRTLLSLEESVISSQADRAIAYIQLYKALGGGWSK